MYLTTPAVPRCHWTFHRKMKEKNESAIVDRNRKRHQAPRSDPQVTNSTAVDTGHCKRRRTLLMQKVKMASDRN